MTTKGVEGTGNFGKFANFLFSTAKVIALRCAAVGSAVTFKQRQGKHVSTGLQITPANRWAGMQHRAALPFLLWCLSSSTLHHTGWADCVVLVCSSAPCRLPGEILVGRALLANFLSLGGF